MNSRSAAILFLSHDSPEWAALAAVAARRYVESPGRVVAACRNGQAVDKVFASVAREDGLFLPGTVESFSESDAFGFDLVICLHGGGNLVVPPFPGVPATISWDLSDLARLEEMDVLSVLRARQSRIIQMVDDLFEQGYLECILQSRANAGLILENLYDGVIAHDLSRRIFYFNRAAEEIAGIRRDEVIGRDCHEVFAERLCGEYCSFCAGCAHFPNAPIRYPVSFRSKTGESRRVEITVVPLKDPMGRPFGVVATLKDVTRESELIRRVGDVDEFHGIVGHEPSIRHVIRIIKDVADTDLPILIQGESGTGKELVAAAIHDLSRRNKRLLVPVNCGALPDTLLESELFGHEKGAFTGAIRHKKGRFELADGGTLFLDEIGDISPAMQVKLLRVLEDGVVERLGSEMGMKVDVRVVAATHKDLRAEVAAGRFRDDLYYRLSVVPIYLPPLRQRREDIPLIAQYLLQKALAESGMEEIVISKEAMDVLAAYDWPGNVRELRNAIRYAIVRCKGTLVEPHHLPAGIQKERPMRAIPLHSGNRRLKLTISAVRQALDATGGNRVKAARLLGVGRATLYRFLSRNSSP